MGSLNLRKYEKDYEKIIDAIVDAFLGKQNRNHMFKTPRYKLLGTLVDNTRQKNGPRLGTFILLLSIKETIKLIEDIDNGKVIDLKKLSLSVDNHLVIQNNRNKYNSGELSHEDILSAPDKYDAELLNDVYVDFVKTAPLYAIENYKSYMSQASLYEILARVNADEHTLEISNESLISILDTLELDSNDYVKISSTLSLGMLPEQRIKLFETISDEKDEAMDAYLFTLFDLEMLAPADAILEISQADEYLNFKAYSALKECNKNFNINLFI